MEPLLRFRDVRHAFGEGTLRRQVLHGVNADLMPGQIVILTGPSGAGKTTILTLGGALRRVQAGSVIVFGQELAGADQAALLAVRRRIGFIFQSPNLLDSLTAVQNVALTLAWNGEAGAEEARRRALEQLERVGLADHAHKYPGQLSGGQRQRVAIARALVGEPQVILADEPTSALDRETGREVVELLHKLARQKGCAILLVTHDHRILDIADHTLSLEDGRLVSYARDAAQRTALLLSGLTQASRPEELQREINELDEAGFHRFMEESTDEFEQLRRKLEEARSQVAASQFDRLLVAATLKAGQLLDADRVTLFAVDRAAGKLRSRVAQSGSQELLQIELGLDQGIAGLVARNGETVNLEDAYEHPLFNRSIDQRSGYRTRSLLCVAVKDDAGQVIAVGQVLNKRGGGAFTAEDEERFQKFLEPIGRLLAGLQAA